MASKSGDFAVILPAAGQSRRFGGGKRKKIFADLNGRAVWLHAAGAFLQRPDVARVVLAIAPEDRDLFERRHRPSVVLRNILVIEGGAERHETVARALEAIGPEVEFVAVHDAARPCVTQVVIDAVFAAARESGAAVPGLPVTDTLRRFADGKPSQTVDRSDLYAMQTPQAFRRDWLVDAYARRRLDPSATITDDAQLIEAAGHLCQIVPGSPRNLKITTQDDLWLARTYLSMPDRPPSTAFADQPERWGSGPVAEGVEPSE
jgi:2-C-methyl-D-erythritol 4-phosphate cytidylyltransferase